MMVMLLPLGLAAIAIAVYAVFSVADTRAWKTYFALLAVGHGIAFIFPAVFVFEQTATAFFGLELGSFDWSYLTYLAQVLSLFALFQFATVLFAVVVDRRRGQDRHWSHRVGVLVACTAAIAKLIEFLVWKLEVFGPVVPTPA